MVLKTPSGSSIGVSTRVLLHVDGPGAGGGGVECVDMNIDVHALISHVQEHVLTGVGAADDGGRLHARTGDAHTLQVTLANATISIRSHG